MRQLLCLALLLCSCAQDPAASMPATSTANGPATRSASAPAQSAPASAASSSAPTVDAAAAEPAPRALPAAPGKWKVTINSRPPFAQVTVLPSGPTLGETPLTAEFDQSVDRVELQFSLDGVKQTQIVEQGSAELLVELPQKKKKVRR